MTLKIDTRDAMRALSRSLHGLARDQIPFAMARTLTAVAYDVAAAEAAQLSQTFDNPTPFTRRAFGVIPARKTQLVATVFARDRQAAYLDPYLDGGRQVLGSKRGMLTPADIPLNAYGNLPRGKLQQLKGRPDIFIGAVRSKSGGEINGVWRRIPPPGAGRRRRGVVQRKSHLQLLIVFTDPKAVRLRLPYDLVARKTVAANLPRQWDAAITRALGTAR